MIERQTFGIVDKAKYLDTPLVISPPERRDLLLSRCAVDEAGAEPGFERVQVVADHRGRERAGFRRRREAARFDHANENGHGFEKVHSSITKF